jgi:hypothetical protein
MLIKYKLYIGKKYEVNLWPQNQYINGEYSWILKNNRPQQKCYSNFKAA